MNKLLLAMAFIILHTASIATSPSAFACHRRTRTASTDFFGSIDSESMAGEDDELSITGRVNHSPEASNEPVPDCLTDQIMVAILNRDLGSFYTQINNASAQKSFNIAQQINTSYPVTLKNGTQIPLFPIQLVTLLLVDRANYPINIIEEDDTNLLTAMLRILLAEGADVHSYTTIEGRTTTSAYTAACQLPFPAHSIARQLIFSADADRIDDAIRMHDHTNLGYWCSLPSAKKATNDYCSPCRHKQRQCALQTAIKTGCEECVKTVLAAGANPILPSKLMMDECNLTHPINLAKALAEKYGAPFSNIYELLW